MPATTMRSLPILVVKKHPSQLSSSKSINRRLFRTKLSSIYKILDALQSRVGTKQTVESMKTSGDGHKTHIVKETFKALDWRFTFLVWMPILYAATSSLLCSISYESGMTARSLSRRVVSYGLRVALAMVIVGGAGLGSVSAAKTRPWSTWPAIGDWHVGKPAGREGLATATTEDGSMWSFGGYNGQSSQTYTNELFKLDAQTKQWTTLPASGAAPSVRSAHAMTAVGLDLYLLVGNSTLMCLMSCGGIRR